MNWKKACLLFILLFSQFCFNPSSTHNGNGSIHNDIESLSTESNSEEDNLELIGQWDQNYGHVEDIFIQDDLAFLACDGLVILNVSNPTNPIFVSQFKDNEVLGTSGVFVKDDLAFIVGYWKGLRILNVTEITNPYLISSYGLHASDIFVQGNYAYIVGIFIEFEIVDISNPKIPVSVGDIEQFNANPDRIIVDGEIAYITSGVGLDIIDVSNPTNPTILNEYHSIEAEDLIIHNQTAYIAASNQGLIVLNITDPANPQNISQVDTDYFTYDICYNKNIVYLSDTNNGLTIINVSDITQPKIIEHSLIFDRAYNIVNKNNTIFLLTNMNEVYFIDIEDPNNPQQIGVFDFGGSAEAIAIDGNFAYVANGRDGLVILDVTNKSKPELKSRINPGNYSTGINILGNYAYVTVTYFWGSPFEKIVIYDVSNKSNPQYVNEFRNNREIIDSQIVGNYLYIISRYNIEIYDITNPAIPILMNYIEEYHYLWCIQIIDNIVFIGTSEELIVLELITPYNISEVNRCFSNTTIFRIAIENEIGIIQVRVDDGVYQFKSIDFSDLRHPKETTFISNELPIADSELFASYSLDVLIKNKKIYTTTAEGLKILKISYNGKLKEIGQYTNRELTDVAIINGIIYLSASYDGVIILDSYLVGDFNVNVLYVLIPVIIIPIIVFVIVKKKKR